MRVIILVPGLQKNLEEIKGGVHSALKNLLHGFSNQDIYIRVLSFTNEVKTETLIQYSSKIEIIYVPEGPFPFHSLNYLFLGPFILKKHIRAFNPDIIHYQTGNSFMFTRLLGLIGRKYLLTIHGMASEEAKRKKKIIDKITWRFNALIHLLMKPENVIHLSRFSKNKHIETKKSKDIIIPNAVVPAFFNVPLKNKTENKLLYIGIIDNNKNIIFLLNNLKRIIDNNKPFTLEVLGDFSNAEMKKYILNFVTENNLTKYVHFNGWVNQTEAIKFITDADILVVSSKHESLPMVIAESMSAGKIVVASDVGGIPEMIDDETDGFLFNLNEPNELFSKLDKLYNNFDLITVISKNAKETAFKKYWSENVAKKTIEFYNECVND